MAAAAAANAKAGLELFNKSRPECTYVGPKLDLAMLSKLGKKEDS